METITNLRRSIRLPGFDYSQAGAYFVTICSESRRCLFGEISDFRMQPNSLGLLVIDCWTRLANDYPFVSLDMWVLMPNHLHAIIWLASNNPSNKTLSQLIAAFKATSTSCARKALGSQFKLWQRGFFEHIVRNQNDLFRIRDYINTNPISWALDPENPSPSS